MAGASKAAGLDEKNKFGQALRMAWFSHPQLSVKRMDDWASLSVFGLGAMRLAKRSPDHGINETDHQIPSPYDGEGG